MLAEESKLAASIDLENLGKNRGENSLPFADVQNIIQFYKNENSVYQCNDTAQNDENNRAQNIENDFAEELMLEHNEKPLKEVISESIIGDLVKFLINIDYQYSCKYEIHTHIKNNLL